MHDPSFMSMVQSVGKCSQHTPSATRIEGTLIQQLLQGPAWRHRHDQENEPTVDPEFLNRKYVRMTDRRDQPQISLEPANRDAINEHGIEHLDSNRLVAVMGGRGHVYRADGTFSQEVNQLVAPERDPDQVGQIGHRHSPRGS